MASKKLLFSITVHESYQSIEEFTKFDTSVKYKYSMKGINRDNKVLRDSIQNLIFY